MWKIIAVGKLFHAVIHQIINEVEYGMKNNLQQQLDWMNKNLNTIEWNQAEIYTELKEIEKEIKGREEEEEMKNAMVYSKEK